MDSQKIHQTFPVKQTVENPTTNAKKINWKGLLVIIAFAGISHVIGIFIGSLKNAPNDTSLEKSTQDATNKVNTINPSVFITPPEKGKIEQVTLAGSDLFVKTSRNEAVSGLGSPNSQYSLLSISIDPSIKQLCEKCTNAVTTTKQFEFLIEQVQSCTTSSECVLFTYGNDSCGSEISLKNSTTDQVSSNLEAYFKVNKYSVQLPACEISGAHKVASACIKNLCQTVYKDAGTEKFVTYSRDGYSQDLDLSLVK